MPRIVILLWLYGLVLGVPLGIVIVLLLLDQVLRPKDIEASADMADAFNEAFVEKKKDQ